MKWRLHWARAGGEEYKRCDLRNWNSGPKRDQNWRRTLMRTTFPNGFTRIALFIHFRFDFIVWESNIGKKTSTHVSVKQFSKHLFSNEICVFTSRTRFLKNNLQFNIFGRNHKSRREFFKSDIYFVFCEWKTTVQQKNIFYI